MQIELRGSAAAGRLPGRHRGPGRPALRAARVGAPGLRLASCAALLAAACASPIVETPDGRIHHRRHGYSVAALDRDPAAGQRWERIEVAGADLAFRGEDGSLVALIAECNRGATQPSLLARQLLIGLGPRQVIESHPVALRGDPGWQTVFRTRGERRPVEVRAVTIRSGTCTFDFVGIAGRPDAPIPGFERFWSSFRRERPQAAA